MTRIRTTSPGMNPDATTNGDPAPAGNSTSAGHMGGNDTSSTASTNGTGAPTKKATAVSDLEFTQAMRLTFFELISWLSKMRRGNRQLSLLQAQIVMAVITQQAECIIKAAQAEMNSIMVGAALNLGSAAIQTMCVAKAAGELKKADLSTTNTSVTAAASGSPASTQVTSATGTSSSPVVQTANGNSVANPLQPVIDPASTSSNVQVPADTIANQPTVHAVNANGSSAQNGAGAKNEAVAVDVDATKKAIAKAEWWTQAGKLTDVFAQAITGFTQGPAKQWVAAYESEKKLLEGVQQLKAQLQSNSDQWAREDGEMLSQMLDKWLQMVQDNKNVAEKITSRMSA